MKDIVIVGSGGIAREVAFIIDEINKKTPTWNLLGFITNDETQVGEHSGKYKIYKQQSWLESISGPLNVVIAIGTPHIIKSVAEILKTNKHLSFPNLVHPNVVSDWDRNTLGEGNIITAGNILTVDINIGSHNIINLNCTIGHDTIIGDYNVINPITSISGGVTIDNNCLIGTGAIILQYKTVKSNTIVGAGALINKDMPGDCTAVGIPAKIIKSKDD